MKILEYWFFHLKEKMVNNRDLNWRSLSKMKNRHIIITLGKELSKIKTDRAAVIPYTVDRGTLKTLLARDKKTKELSDFGGGVKKHECALNAAIREFKEESCEVFEDVKINETSQYIAIYDSDLKMSVLFIPISIDVYNKIPEKFKCVTENSNHTLKKEYNEISEIVQFNDTALRLLLEQRYCGEKMWNRLSSFYRQCFDSDLIDILKAKYVYAYHTPCNYLLKNHN